MPGPQALRIEVPVTGEVLVRFTGASETHPVGSFEQRIPVTLDPGSGTMLFNWTPEVWEKIREGSKGGRESDPPLLQHPEKSTHDIVEGVLERAMEVYPDDLASRICGVLGSEGRLSG